MTIQWRTGDVFTVESKAMAHGVNCFGQMGAGIARTVARRWPQLAREYQRWCAGGLLSLGDCQAYRTDDDWTIFNLASQYYPGKDARCWAVTASVGAMVRRAIESRIDVIGMPMIGCGIGGLDPEGEQLRMCLAPFADAPVTLAVYRYAPGGGYYAAADL